MTDDRWQRVKELFQAAVERPSAERARFLASAAGDDEALRREVESLLASDAVDVGFLGGLTTEAVLGDSPSFLRTSMGQPQSEPVLSPHTHIGSYEIVAPLGVGGMGEVYRARDATLGRDVAIKILPHGFTSHPDRLARFEREARMLAALNHPNICAIYGFEQADPSTSSGQALSAGSGQAAVRFLILELVDGETLADRLARAALRQPGAGLPLRDALSIARQIAEALEAAHDKGIIHRDLKPANIKITPDGVVKVLDFGLAKAVGGDGSSPDLTHVPEATAGGRREGIVMGTARYMSPEQARGQAVDRRTDIWAFGCVLYEMLTGRVTFAGDTVSDTIARILEREPDWSALPRTLRPGVVTLLQRCLEKDAKRRLRDIGDARLELDDALTQPGMRERPERSVQAPRWRRLAPVAAALAVLTVLAAQFWPQPSEVPLANATFKPFTNFEGREEGAEISPNGELVAFLSDLDGEFDLWVSQVGTGIYHNLTRDFPPLAASGFIVRKLGFNADSSRIWFNPGDGKQPMIVPWTGGKPQPLLPAGTNTPAWSPDGTRLVYIDKANSDDPIYLSDPTGGDPQQIFGPGPLKNMNPVWAPDGKWIYFTRGSEPQDEAQMDVWRLRPSGGEPERVTTQHLAINFLAPLDLRRLLYVARAEDRSGPWLWLLDVASGVSTRVPSGVDQYTSVSASRDGRRIVATAVIPGGRLWQVPLLDRPAVERDVQPYGLPMPTGLAFAPRFGKDSLFYLSDRGTSDGLWKVQDGQASQVRRGVDGALSEPAAVSSDGRLAVVVRKEGKRYLSIMSADGTNARTLAPSIEIEGAAGQGAADWSPDGTRLVAGGRDGKGPALFVIPVDGGGPPVRLLEGSWVNPVWSPTGDLIVYAGRSLIGQVELRAVRPQDGTPVELPHVMARPGGYRFLPDGTGLVFVERIQALDFWLLDLATGQRRQLTRLDNQGALRTFDITPDGKSIVFDRLRQNSNVVLIELPK